MITDETKPEDFRNIREGDYAHIYGWGIDADRKNDPTYPMKRRTNEEHKGYTWERPAQQYNDLEILKSVERPNLTAVYGTSASPKGLSGMIRRFAYKYSESSYGRWLPLVLADRIDMVEGIFEDLGRGHIPNIHKELGMGADWKYNRRAYVAKVAIGAIVVGGIISLMISSSDEKLKTAKR